MDLERYAAIVAQQSGQRTGRRPRSTLTAASATILRPFFDEACDTLREILIPYAMFPRCSPNTVYTKVCDALLWYTEIDQTITPEERRKYVLLKASFKLIQSEKGVRFTPRLVLSKEEAGRVTSHSHVQAAAQVFAKEHQATSVSWKKEFLDWVQNGPVGSTFHRKGLALTADDVEWVINYAKTLDWAAKATIDSVLVTKET